MGEEGKKKGSGVRIIIDKRWKKHVVKLNRKNLYILDLVLDFKGLSINIIVVYIAPTSVEVQKIIYEYLKERLRSIEAKKKEQRCIVVRDFNMNLNQTVKINAEERKEKEGKNKYSSF